MKLIYPLVVLLAGAAMTAQAQTVPFAHTQAAGPVSSTNATLNGMVVPNGADTVVWFDWGTNSNLGQTTPPIFVGTGSGVLRVIEAIGSLPSCESLCYRLVASNSLGVVFGAPVFFTTGKGVLAWGYNSDGQLNVPASLTNAIAVSAGWFHGLALKSDMTVVGWGANFSGQASIPAGLSNVVSIAAGAYHSVALKQDGTVVVWGNGVEGETNVPSGLNNVVAIAAGAWHSLALKVDGKVVAWGYNGAGEVDIPLDLSNAVSVACGELHSLALKADGTVAAWGDNSSGQLNVPSGLSNVVNIAAGLEHSLALKADGSVAAWGDNTWGQISVPAGLSNVLAMAAGDFFSFALKQDLTAVGWGRNVYGALNVPGELRSVFCLTGGSDYSLAVGNSAPRGTGQTNFQTGIHDFTITLNGSDPDSDGLSFRIATLPNFGALYQWTANGRGALVTTTNVLVEDLGRRIIFAMSSPGSDDFTFLANDGLADSLTANVHVTFAPPWACTQPPQPAGNNSARLRGTVLGGTGGKMWFEWGLVGGYGQTTAIQDEATNGIMSLAACQVTNLATQSNYQYRVVASNSCGVFYGAPVFFSTGRKVVAWGPSKVTGQTNVPAGLGNVFAIAAGDSHSLALRPDGTIAAWGGNANGQCNVPADLTNMLSVAAGYDHSLALKADGTVAAWGDNSYGQTAVPVGLTNVVSIVAGPYHNLAVRADGTLVAWGDNSSGQTSIPEDLEAVVAVVAGRTYSMALTPDGTVRKWGNGSSPTGFTNVVTIASGYLHSLVLKSNGSVNAWGDNAYGQCNVPAGLSNVVALAGGEVQSLALLQGGRVINFGGFAIHAVPAGLSNVVAVAGGYHSLALGNVAPLSQSQTVILSSTQDVTISLKATDVNADEVSFRITALPTTGTLFQWTPSGRGGPITTTNTLVDDVGGRVIYAPTISGTSFTFVANDGLADSTPAQVAITIVPPKASTQLAQPTGFNAVRLFACVVAGSGSRAWFEWGTFNNLSERTPEITIESDLLWTRVSAALTNLQGGANYQFRIVVSNSLGTVYGGALPFTTGQRVSAWGVGVTSLPVGLSNVVAIASNGTNNLALKFDGTLTAWGNAASGQLNIPTGLSNVMGIAVGGSHCLAVKLDGTVVAWGTNTFGQANIPLGLSNVVAVAAGANHSVALKADGKIIAWGNNGLSQTNVPSSLTNAVAVSSFANYNVALTLDGNASTWGSLSLGFSFPPAGATNLVSVAVGGSHALVGRLDGKAFGWGNSLFLAQNVPVGLSNVVAVAAGGNHSLALKSDGTVVAWGANNSGQASIPVGLSNTVALAAGFNHSLALAPNVKPLANSFAVTGAVNMDWIVPLLGSDANNDSIQFRISGLPSAGSLFQFTTNGRGSPIASSGTLVDDSLNRVYYAPQPDSAGWPYTSFAYATSDGDGDSVPATVTMNIIPMPVINSINSSVTSNGAFSFTFAGVSNATYRAWGSTNLVNWSVLGAATQSPLGQFNFTDNGATNRPLRFYRVTSP